jgi:hypothetical protein
VKDVLLQLQSALEPMGFRRIKEGDVGCVCGTIWKRQNLNMNRAVAVIHLDALPEDLAPLLKKVKKEAAFRCGFFPFFYGLGTQLILIVAGSISQKPEVLRYVDKIDNQWSIIQSIFVVQADSGLVDSARTWGQIFTGKFQNAIMAALA